MRTSIAVLIHLLAGNIWPQLLDVLKPFASYSTAVAIAGGPVVPEATTLQLNDPACPETILPG